MQYTLIFDIGKTNKKAFLFDNNHQVVWQTNANFQEIKDEDGFPCDDLNQIVQWIKVTFKSIRKKYKISYINFSTYGASFVHLDKKGKPLTPLYNYLKPYPEDLLDKFYKKYGHPNQFAKTTASSNLGMLNSGLQLYWLKYTKPKIFKKIKYSLHFPQYLSYLFSNVAFTEFTSIGCHTGLWDFGQDDYHHWVYKEGIAQKFPPLVQTNTIIHQKINKQFYKIGIGIHDSSAALLPYLKAVKRPFILVSTGTWSITLNPFNSDLLTKNDLENDCLNYMQIDGKPVKAARLFLGNEHQFQVNELQKTFNTENDFHKKIELDESILTKLQKDFQTRFSFKTLQIKRPQPKKSQLQPFKNFKEAYHQLMLELVALQIEAIDRAIGKTKIKTIYIDGGFIQNDLFIQLLARHYKKKKVFVAESPIGSALGAMMVMQSDNINPDFLEKNYSLRLIQTKTK